jgi:hypothetical protein
MACSTSVRRGNLAKVEVDGVAIARTTEWEATEEVEVTEWGDSDSEGYTNAVPGKKKLSGSMTGKFDDDDPVYDLFAPGDNVALVLWENTTSYWALPCALITNFNIVYNKDTKEPVEWTADWIADNVYYRPGAAGAPSETYPS